MLTIFQCTERVSGEPDEQLIGFTTNHTLADLVVYGKSSISLGNGEIHPIQVWETEDELPDSIKKRIQGKTTTLTASISELAKEVRKLSTILNAPANTIGVLETLSHLKAQHEAMVALRDKLNEFLGNI